MRRPLSPYDAPRLLWALALAFVLVWLYMLGARTLVPTDEGRYAEMAREMLASGDWLTPRLNGIKYFEKPPLQNWMNAISFALFGLGEWQARLWTGLCGLFGIAVTAYTARQLFGRRVAISTALILASSFYWAGMGHINTLDMGLAAMMALAMCALLLAQREGASAAQQRSGMLLCYLGMALATLSKALPGAVLPGAVLVLYTLATRDWALWKRLHLGKGLALFLLVTAPWFIAMWQVNPEHPHFFFIHEHWERLTSKVHHREGAWYYFFPVLLLGIFPWLGLLLQGLRAGWRGVAGKFQPEKLLLIWSVFIFFFFSISGSKLPSYILPIFPALALLIAVALERAGLRALRGAAGLLLATGAIALAVLPKLAGMGESPFEAALYRTYLPWLAGAAGLCVAGGAAALWRLRAGLAFKDAAVVIMAAAGFIAGQVAFLGHEPFGRYIAGTAHVPALQAELARAGAGTKLYAVGRYEQSLPFYLRHTVILVEHADEMEFGLGLQPELWLPRREQFRQAWLAHIARKETALAIVRPDIFADLQKQNVPMRVLGQDPKRAVIATPLAATNH